MAKTHDKDLSDGNLWRRRLQWGGREIPRNPPGTRNIRDKSDLKKITGAEAWSPRDCLCEGTV